MTFSLDVSGERQLLSQQLWICFRPYFKVQPGFLVFAFLLLNRNYPKG